ncbi:hypothetical protein G7Y89_g5403 [Cudoniella acicularis]|uniref:Major facilitator superfamily (MFS) profile domain-containing protein n=1 Tax=Cudoniella acicularis TaxID=354080 RepID=A0A8H4RMI5_9HELO|nr:hypothetical protein G7Y89_g5403 [Cudoniella acicularis]
MAAVDASLVAVESRTDDSPPFEDTAAGPGKRPECFSSTIQECLFVLTATMSIGMSSFLYGICTVITAPIGRDLQMTSAEITWINASSSLSSGAFLLFFAKIADTFGRRSLLIFSMGAFSISSLIAGFATNAMYLDIFCGLLGLWGAASVPPAIGILGAAYEVPSKRKNRAFACFSAGNPVGFVLGSIFSGVAANLFNWRASFWLLSIIYAVFFLAALWTVPKTQVETEKFTLNTLQRFDLFGILLSMAGIALFCSSLTIAGDAPKGWRTSYVLVLLLLGIALIFSFISWEGFCKYPLMPLRIWRDRNFSLINVIVLLGFMAFSTQSFWLSLYMQNVLGFSALKVAIHLLPQAIGGILVNVIAGLILHRVNNKLLTGLGALAYFGSAILLATMSVGSSYWAFIFPSLLLSVIGADFQFNVANMYVMSSLPPHQQSLAGGIFNTVTKICTAVGLGISASIYNAESTGTAALQTGIRPYKMVFWFCVACAGCSILFVPWLRIGTQGHGEGSGGTSVVSLGKDAKDGFDGGAEKDKVGEREGRKVGVGMGKEGAGTEEKIVSPIFTSRSYCASSVPVWASIGATHLLPCEPLQILCDSEKLESYPNHQLIASREISESPVNGGILMSDLYDLAANEAREEINATQTANAPPDLLGPNNINPLSPSQGTSTHTSGHTPGILSDNQTPLSEPNGYQDKVDKIHWQLPTTMVSTLVAGIFFAVAHHGYYMRLHGRVVGNASKQRWALNIGNGIAVLVHILLKTAVGIAQTQSLWRKLTSNSLSMKGINNAFGVGNNVFALLSWELIIRVPVNSVVALILWLLPLSSFLTPSTLSIPEPTVNNTAPYEVTTLGVYNSTLFNNTDDMLAVERVVSNVAISGKIPPIDLPFAHETASYQLQSFAPVLRCNYANSTSQSQLIEILTNATKQSEPFLDYNASKAESTFQLDEKTLNWSLVDKMGAMPRTGHILVTIPNYEDGKQEPLFIDCGLYNASLNFRVTLANNSSQITEVDLGWIDSTDSGGTILQDCSMAEHPAASLLFTSTTPFLRGYIGWASQLDLASGELRNRSQGNRLLEAYLGQSLQIRKAWYGVMTSLRWDYEPPKYKEAEVRNMSWSEHMEEFWLNATLGLLSQPQLCNKELTNVTFTSAQTVYNYEPRSLIIAYSLSVAASTAAVILGSIALYRNGVGYDNTFSSFATVVQNDSFRKALEGQSPGIQPLGKGFPRTRIKMKIYFYLIF